MVNVDEIIAKKKITELCTLEILHDITQSENMKIDSSALNI
jgi:hypothetical protein